MSKKVIIGAVVAVLILGGAVAGIIALRGSNGSTGTKCDGSEELKDGKCVAQKEVDIYAKLKLSQMAHWKLGHWEIMEDK